VAPLKSFVEMGASSFETATLRILGMKSEIPHGEERGNAARFEPSGLVAHRVLL